MQCDVRIWLAQEWINSYQAIPSTLFDTQSTGCSKHVIDGPGAASFTDSPGLHTRSSVATLAKQMPDVLMIFDIYIYTYVICIHMIGSADLGCILLSALRIGLVHTAVIRWKDAGLCNVSLCLFELRPSTTISRIVPCAKITRLKPSEAEETRGNKRQQEARTAHTHTQSSATTTQVSSSSKKDQ